MNQKIKTEPILTTAFFIVFSALLGLSFWWSVCLSIVGYFIGLDDYERKEAIKNGDDLSRWPKEKAKKDFQEWLNKH